MLPTSATAAAESILPEGWWLDVGKKFNGQWLAVCRCAHLLSQGASIRQALAMATPALKAVKQQSGKP